jgi:hypothetical protein
MLRRDTIRVAVRRRTRRFGRRRDDAGQALILVLVVTGLVVILLTAVVGSVVSGLATSTQYTRTNQAQLAAQTGVATELAAMRSVATWVALPCSGSGNIALAGATSSYSVAITYFGAGNQLTCNGSTLGGTTPPSLAHLVSTGTATGGWSSHVVADASIAVAAAIDPFPGYAIFTHGVADFTNVTLIDKSTYGDANVYADGLVSCNNAITEQGTLITYDSVDVLNLHNTCTFSNVVSAGPVAMSNGSNISGNVTSYGTSTSGGCSGTWGICVSNGITVGGNATAIGPNAGIGLQNMASIAGNADAEGSVTNTGGSIGGTTTQNDSSLASRHIDTDYPPITFPLYDPTPVQWTAAFWNVIIVGQPGYPTCASYFADTPNDPFMTAMANTTVKTAFYAPTCALNFTQKHNFDLGADIALQVASLTLTNQTTFDPTHPGTKTSPVSVNFALLAGADQKCSTSTLDVSFSNNTAFAPIPVTDPYSTVNTLIYSEGEVDFTNLNQFYGQIMACGGFTSTNAMTLTYSPLAGQAIASVGESPVPTIAVKDKYAG